MALEGLLKRPVCVKGLVVGRGRGPGVCLETKLLIFF